MANIKIIFKDGTEREFLHEGRAGGSYTKEVKYIADFAVITDEWHRQFIFPSGDIKEIKVEPHRGSF